MVLGGQKRDKDFSKLKRRTRKMKSLSLIFLALTLTSLANCQGTLLEMSQQLWAKLLSGGFSKAGRLDPLKVPMIKVDQSEGNTSYRIILRNVEITGLNESTLDSIHIARGRLRSNLSELEAGYVSYSDLRDLDSIRYRFHTLVKEPKGQNESFEAIVSATDQRTNRFANGPREEESRFERLRMYDPFLMKIQAEKMRATDRPSTEPRKSRQNQPPARSFNMEGAKVLSRSETTRIIENLRYPSDVQMIYAMSAINSSPRSSSSQEGRSYIGRRENEGREDQGRGKSGGRDRYGDDVETMASENVERVVKGERFVPGQIGREQARQSRIRLEDKPGYIDIVYADGDRDGGVKRFGNGRIESKQDARVFGVKGDAKVRIFLYKKKEYKNKFFLNK